MSASIWRILRDITCMYYLVFDMPLRMLGTCVVEPFALAQGMHVSGPCEGSHTVQITPFEIW
jgi:hypothetical protein